MAFSHAGELAALGTACCWTLTAMIFESAGKRVGSLPVNLLRLVIGLAFLAAFGMVVRGTPVPTDAPPGAWLWLSLSGVVGLTIGDLCFFQALVVLGARLSILLMALVPPLTALIGWAVLGERLEALDWLGMAMTVGGVVWVTLERRPAVDGRPARLTASGLLLGVGAALGQAVGLILSKFGMGSYDAFAATEIRVMAGLAGFVVVFAALGWWSRVGAALRDGVAMARIGLGAFFGPFVGVSLSLYAVQHAPAGVAATIIEIQPVLILIPAALVFGERITLRAAAGAVLAVGGAALLFL
ncbi:MAG: DMT family transporter [Deltaproteobacteria bacterium]|nr:DMT family transporter [Deltaproteobacteria bacterium]